ncbi:unnamed protein product, partial [Polarella glacialis]
LGPRQLRGLRWPRPRKRLRRRRGPPPHRRLRGGRHQRRNLCRRSPTFQGLQRGCDAQVLVCGDLHGRLPLLQEVLQGLREKGTPADFVLAAGCFLPTHVRRQMADFMGPSPVQTLSAPVFFVDSSSEEFISRAVETSSSCQLGRRLTFLGGCGVTEIQGLRVAFLSGTYEEADFRSIWGVKTFKEKDGNGQGAHYTKLALNQIKRQASEIAGRKIDVLLTSEWPDTFWSTAFKKEAANPVDRRFSSPAVRQLFFELKPRYHVHAGANVCRFRKADQGPHDFVCNSAALAEAHVGSDAEDKRWYQLITMRPGDSGRAEAQ